MPKKPPEVFAATLTISHFGRSGDGVAVHTLDGKSENIFVPYALPGEVLQAEVTRRAKLPTTAKITQILQAAPSRAQPPCQHFGVCGGCALQHLSAEAYQNFKLGWLQHELDRAGIVPQAMLPMHVSPLGSRRRVVYSSRKFKNGDLSVGFNERGAHWLVNVQECKIVQPAIAALLPPLRNLLNDFLHAGDKTDIAVTAFPEGLDVVLLGLPRLSIDGQDWRGREALAEFAQQHNIARLSIKSQKVKLREPVYESDKPSRQFGVVKVHPPAGAFLQASDDGEAAMMQAVRTAIQQYAPQAKNLADLFCGSGTFSGVLAEFGSVLAIDSEGESIAALAAAKHQKIITRTADLFTAPIPPAELNAYEVVVIDPPRAGCVAQATALAASRVPLIISISCNPETFARDSKILVAGGYQFVSCAPIDQFRFAAHLEVVGVFVKRV